MLKSALKLEKMYAPKLIYVWRKFWNSYVRNAQICTYTGENVGICTFEMFTYDAPKLIHGWRKFWNSYI